MKQKTREPKPEPDPALREQIHLATSRCPFCHDDAAAQESVVCQDCLARHHSACWSEAGCCSSCQGTTRLGPAEAPPAQVDYFSGRKTTQLAIGVGLLMLLFIGFGFVDPDPKPLSIALFALVGLSCFVSALIHAGKPVVRFTADTARIRRPGWGLRRDWVVPLRDVIRTELVQSSWKQVLLVHYRDSALGTERVATIPLPHLDAGDQASIKEAFDKAARSSGQASD